MKIASVLALSGWLAMAGTVSAEQREGAPGGFTPTPGMITMMSLGQSGLLGSMFSNEVYGNTQNKMGQSRATIGYIEDSLIRQGVPEAMWPAFKDRGTTFVMPMALIKELPSASGASFIRLNVEPNWARARSHLPVRTTGGARRVDLQFLHAPVPTRIFGVGLMYERSEHDIDYTEDPANATGHSKRDAWGLRVDYAEAYTRQWGVTARAEYQKGKADWIASNDFFRQHDRYDENRLYAQVELIGTFTSREIGVLPESWLFRPILGGNYQRSIMGAASDSVVNKKYENYGAVWARARFEKKQVPGPQWQIMPNFSIGLEREYVNDLDKWLVDSTYALASVGVGMTRGAFRVDVEYNLRKGLKNNRAENVISAAMVYQL